MQSFGLEGLRSAIQRDIDETFPTGTTVDAGDYYQVLYDYIDSYLVYNSDIERWAGELGLDPEDYEMGDMAEEISLWITEQVSEPDGYTDH